MARLRRIHQRRRRQWRAATAQHESKAPGEGGNSNHMEIDGHQSRLNSFTVFFDADELALQEAWPTVKLALAVLKISATLNLDEGSMTVSTTTRTRDPSYLSKAVSVLQLLASGLPVFKAIKVLKRHMVHEIMKIGFQKDGLCSKFGITEKQFLRRRKEGLDATQLKAINEYTCCEMFVHGEIVSAIGPSPKILEVAMWAVEGCIVHKELPSHRLKDFFGALRLHRQTRKLSALLISKI